MKNLSIKLCVLFILMTFKLSLCSSEESLLNFIEQGDFDKFNEAYQDSTVSKEGRRVLLEKVSIRLEENRERLKGFLDLHSNECRVKNLIKTVKYVLLSSAIIVFGGVIRSIFLLYNNYIFKKNFSSALDQEGIQKPVLMNVLRIFKMYSVNKTECLILKDWIYGGFCGVVGIGYLLFFKQCEFMLLSYKNYKNLLNIEKLIKKDIELA